MPDTLDYDDFDDSHRPNRRGMARRKDDRHVSRWNWGMVGVIVTVVLILLTAMLNISNRVTTLENQSRNDSARMERVEQMVYRIWERVK